MAKKEIKTENLKTSGSKKSTKKTETVVKNPMEEMMKNMTPEMMQQFMLFVQQQQSPKVDVQKAEVKQNVINKSYLSRMRDKEVVVRSASNGVVGFLSDKTQMFYQWINKGDVEILTIGEILEMDSKSKKFLRTPWLIVEDDEVNQGLGLVDIKEVVNVFDDFEEFVKLPIEKIKEHIHSVGRGFRPTLTGMFRQAIEDGALTDYRKIREIEKVLGTEFRY